MTRPITESGALTLLPHGRKHMIQIGTRVGYIGPTVERPWLPRGTEGVVTDFFPGTPFPIICNFNVPEGDDWPMQRRDLEVIR